jgi:hypothetical protein
MRTDDEALELWKKIAGLPDSTASCGIGDQVRQFLADGRYRPLRPVLGSLL